MTIDFSEFITLGHITIAPFITLGHITIAPDRSEDDVFELTDNGWTRNRPSKKPLTGQEKAKIEAAETPDEWLLARYDVDPTGRRIHGRLPWSPALFKVIEYGLTDEEMDEWEDSDHASEIEGVCWNDVDSQHLGCFECGAAWHAQGDDREAIGILVHPTDSDDYIALWGLKRVEKESSYFPSVKYKQLVPLYED